MSITLITAIAAIIAVVIARIGYVCWYNDTLKQAKRAMREANRHEDTGDWAYDRIETYHAYGEAKRYYRKAARLYLKLGKRSDAKFAVYKAVEMRKLFEKYLYM